MAYETIELLINGEWRKGDGGGQDIINPADESVIGWCPHASAEELDMALAAADEGFKVWKNMTALARQKIMTKAADLMDERVDYIAECLTREEGKPHGES